MFVWDLWWGCGSISGLGSVLWPQIWTLYAVRSNFSFLSWQKPQTFDVFLLFPAIAPLLFIDADPAQKLWSCWQEVVLSSRAAQLFPWNRTSNPWTAWRRRADVWQMFRVFWHSQWSRWSFLELERLPANFPDSSSDIPASVCGPASQRVLQVLLQEIQARPLLITEASGQQLVVGV